MFMSVNSPVTSNEIKGFFPPGIVTGLGIILVALVVAKLAYGRTAVFTGCQQGSCPVDFYRNFMVHRSGATSV